MNVPQTSATIERGPTRLVVIHSHPQQCPYLPDRIATMPLSLVVGQRDNSTTDHWLAMGYRRSGEFVYRTTCRSCSQCIPTRLAVERFKPSKSMRRVRNRVHRELTWRWSTPIVDEDRLKLFNRHRSTRGLSHHDELVTAQSYESFLLDSCCRTRELATYHEGQLVAISICDLGEDAASAVYTFFDPAADRWSLGTWGVLEQIEHAKQTERTYLYLGMYVADNSHLNYKARFGPQQRFIGGQWIDVP